MGVKLPPLPIVGATDADAEPGTLDSKLAAGAGITLTVINPGANEQVRVAATGGGALPTPTQAGEVLYACDATAFVITLPLVSNGGWLISDAGLLLAVG